ncbi:MAG TPA: hypothetical protein VGZ32_01190 [Actinocrinis sp.]|uniref:hypothetical protein n=1 Tax=Actinocrinis sp. TaxID=1920516 RepID=UPI002DDD48B5|nr:hypothetical protein [Actinocrinis sp.]HEV3168918.1 hypothetical protein [Actinocrinis sp.]
MALIAICAALPFALTAIVVLARPDTFVLRGDSAVIELAVRNAAEFAQQLGPYSRFGWTHPGPLWFYALVPIYVLGGETAASLLASVEFLNAVFCVLIVLAAARRRVGSAIGAAAAVLIFTLAAPNAVFAEIWNPYATVLPALLFLVLIARAADGSALWLLGALIVGSFLVQTHLGTALPVFACLIAVVLFMAISRAPTILRRLRSSRPRIRRSRALAAFAGTTILFAVWIPPLQDQLSGTRNLTTIARFLKAIHKTGTGHTAAQGFALIERLAIPPSWSIDMVSVLTPHSVSAAVVCGLCGVVLVNVAIAVVAWRCAAHVATYIAALAVLLVPLGIAAVVQIDGNLHNYLIAWFLAAPAATVLAACLLLAEVRFRTAPRGRVAANVGSALAVALVLLTGTATAVLVPRAGHSADCCTQNGILAADRSLLAATGTPSHSGAPIDIRYDANGEWPLATALAASLAEHGWSPHLPAAVAGTFKLPATDDDPTAPTVWIQTGTEQPPRGYRVIARVPGAAMWQSGDFVGIVELRR